MTRVLCGVAVTADQRTVPQRGMLAPLRAPFFSMETSSCQ
jgi:hypothetical protein